MGNHVFLFINFNYSVLINAENCNLYDCYGSPFGQWVGTRPTPTIIVDIGVGAGLVPALNQNNINILGRQRRLPLQIKYHSNLCDTFWGRGQKRSLHDTFSGPVPKRVTYKLQFILIKKRGK